MIVEFTVVGIPKPQARPKVFHRTLKSGRPFIHTYSPKSDWYHLVYVKALEEKEKLKTRLSGALKLTLKFCLPIPKSISKKKREQLFYVSKRGDIDNYCKAIMDAINQVGIWEDDGQVALLVATKIYSEQPRCDISIEQLE